MNKAAFTAYLLWSLFLIGVGLYIVKKINDTSDPNSLKSNFQKLEETFNENP